MRIWLGPDLRPQAVLIRTRNIATPVISGVEFVGEIMSVTIGEWAGPPLITYRYQWQNDGGVGLWADISGATAQNYTIQPGDAGQRLRCVVTALAAPALANDAPGATAAISNESGLISSTQIRDFNASDFNTGDFA